MNGTLGYPISPPPPDMINEKLQVFREQTELPEYWTIFLRVVQGWDYHGDCRRYYREHKMVAMIRDTAHQVSMHGVPSLLDSIFSMLK